MNPFLLDDFLLSNECIKRLAGKLRKEFSQNNPDFNHRIRSSDVITLEGPVESGLEAQLASSQDDSEANGQTDATISFHLEANAQVESTGDEINNHVLEIVPDQVEGSNHHFNTEKEAASEGPLEDKPLEENPLEKGPMEGPLEKGPLEKGPLEKGPLEKGPLEKGPLEKGPLEKGPLEEGPLQKGAPEERASLAIEEELKKTGLDNFISKVVARSKFPVLQTEISDMNKPTISTQDPPHPPIGNDLNQNHTSVVGKSRLPQTEKSSISENLNNFIENLKSLIKLTREADPVPTSHQDQCLPPSDVILPPLVNPELVPDCPVLTSRLEPLLLQPSDVVMPQSRYIVPEFPAPASHPWIPNSDTIMSSPPPVTSFVPPLPVPPPLPILPLPVPLPVPPPLPLPVPPPLPLPVPLPVPPPLPLPVPLTSPNCFVAPKFQNERKIVSDLDSNCRLGSSSSKSDAFSSAASHSNLFGRTNYKTRSLLQDQNDAGNWKNPLIKLSKDPSKKQRFDEAISSKQRPAEMKYISSQRENDFSMSNSRDAAIDFEEGSKRKGSQTKNGLDPVSLPSVDRFKSSSRLNPSHSSSSSSQDLECSIDENVYSSLRFENISYRPETEKVPLPSTEEIYYEYLKLQPFESVEDDGPAESFQSTDPRENWDNNPARWEAIQKLSSDSDRRDYAQRQFKNPEPVNPTVSATYFGRARFTNAEKSGVDFQPEGGADKVVLRDGKLEILDSESCDQELYEGRKRRHEMDDYFNGCPSKKTRMVDLNDFEMEMVIQLKKLHSSKMSSNCLIQNSYQRPCSEKNLCSTCYKQQIQNWLCFLRHFKSGLAECQHFIKLYRQGSQGSMDQIPRCILERSIRAEKMFSEFNRYYGKNEIVFCSKCKTKHMF